MKASCCTGGSNTVDRSLLEHTAVPLDKEVGNWQLASDHPAWEPVASLELAVALRRVVWTARALTQGDLPGGSNLTRKPLQDGTRANAPSSVYELRRLSR